MEVPLQAILAIVSAVYMSADGASSNALLQF